MDNNTCINCSHEKVCKYKDELDKKIKELNVFDGKEDPLFTLLRISLSCGFYKSEIIIMKDLSRPKNYQIFVRPTGTPKLSN